MEIIGLIVKMGNDLSGDVVGKATAMEVLRGGRLQTIDVIVGER